MVTNLNILEKKKEYKVLTIIIHVTFAVNLIFFEIQVQVAACFVGRKCVRWCKMWEKELSEKKNITPEQEGHFGNRPYFYFVRSEKKFCDCEIFFFFFLGYSNLTISNSQCHFSFCLGKWLIIFFQL